MAPTMYKDEALKYGEELPGGPMTKTLHPPMQGAWVQSPDRELDSTRHNSRFCMPQQRQDPMCPQLRPSCNQINK